MPDYIEKEPLLQKAKELQGELYAAPLIVEAIENAPTADVVEVVRCKDCGNYNKHYGECNLNGSHFGENGFCSCGKRKEVENA